MSTPAAPHTPVMLDRIVELFASTPDGPIVDGTLGAGGHAAAIVAARMHALGHATLIGIDRDPSALALAKVQLAEFITSTDVTIVLHKARFDAIDDVLMANGIGAVAGVLLDLGVSSMHLDQSARGFSYRQDADLDMRMDPDLATDAASLVNTSSEAELARILHEYGDERYARRIARQIVANRPVLRTVALAELIRDAIPAAARRTGGHPATRSFQALRIAVNGELDALAAVLPLALRRLVPGGIVAVLSYHSLEDQLVKRAFAEVTKGCVCPPKLPVCVCERTVDYQLITRKVERPGAAELAANPRASAARLRAIRRLEQPVTSRDAARRPSSGQRP